MYEKRLCGVVIPTITPMNEDGPIDDASLADFTRYLLETGINAPYPNGTNGESLLLTKEERDHVAEVMANVNTHCLPLSIQCGSTTTGETASHAAHAVDIGADGIDIMSPAFFQMNEEALFRYYRDVVKGLPENLPVYIYNIPGCTTNDVKPGLLQKLMEEFPNIVGIRYSSLDLMRVEDYLETDGRKPELLIGCDSLFLQCLMTGGVGTVTGSGSIFHERFTRFYRQHQGRDYAGAVTTQKKIMETDRKLVGTPDIPALKTLLKLHGVIRTDIYRGPLHPLKEDEKRILEEIYAAYCEEEGIREWE